MIFWELSEAILLRLRALQSKQVVARLKLQINELPRLKVLMRLELLLLPTFSILAAS